MKVLAWFIVALSLAAPASGRATGQLDAAATPAPAALDREARQIETMLIAPCCWTEQVSQHHSEAAEQVKREIRTMLASGLTRQQVLDGFVRRYGVRILAEPPDQGFGRVLYHAPWIVGLGSALGLFFFIRRVTRRPAAERPAGGPRQPDGAAPVTTAEGETAAEESYNQRLDDELRDLD